MEDETTTATAVLRREHDLILSVVAGLERALGTEATGAGPDQATMARSVSFIRRFADLCHHGKEEELLFPALEQHGLPADQGPIAVMLAEHDEGRDLVRQMATALDGPAPGDRIAIAAFTTAARGYIELIRGHIAKENMILFEMADGLLVGDELAGLRERYDEVDRGRFEGSSKVDLEQMAEELGAS